MMISSHAGSLVAGLSSFLNQIYYSQDGTPKLGCHDGLDRYFLFYLGLMAAMITLTLNAYKSHKGIVKKAWLVASRTSAVK